MAVTVQQEWRTVTAALTAHRVVDGPQVRAAKLKISAAPKTRKDFRAAFFIAA
jgi:hypothetical protein